MWRLAGLSCQLGPPRSILAPPTQFSSLGLAGKESTYQGGFLRFAPLLITRRPPPPTPALAPARHKSQTLSNSTLHPQADQEVAVHRAHTSPGAPQVPPPPPPLAPSSAAQGRARGSPRGKGPPAPQPRLPGPRRPAGSGPHAAYLKAGTGPPTFLLRIANRTAGEGPPAGHSSASAALAESPGPNVRRGRTGGWLFFGGGD